MNVEQLNSLLLTTWHDFSKVHYFAVRKPNTILLGPPDKNGRCEGEMCWLEMAQVPKMAQGGPHLNVLYYIPRELGTLGNLPELP